MYYRLKYDVMTDVWKERIVSIFRASKHALKRRHENLEPPAYCIEHRALVSGDFASYFI
jgi:hypothetical protein